MWIKGTVKQLLTPPSWTANINPLFYIYILYISDNLMFIRYIVSYKIG